jgi:hypothetical protein
VKFPSPIALLTTLALTAGVAAAQSDVPRPPDAPAPSEVPARADVPPLDLVVQAGRPLRVVLPERIRLRQVGQVVTGTLVEPVYAYDRIVVPAGTRVRGHVKALEPVGGGARARAILSGDLTPLRRAVLEFDVLVLQGGREIPVSTEVRFAADRLALSVREPPRGKGLAGRTAERLTDDAKATLAHAVAAVKQPGRLRRLKEALVGGLPYHPQYLRAGTVYTASLRAPLHFGEAEPTEPAPPGTVPAPDSILRARLLTPLDSRKTPKGSAVEAVVTQPLFSEDKRLILPEGTVLTGEVTFARPAGHFHRNGQLRFLFESVRPPERDALALRASLYSVQSGREQGVAVDDEGGTTITNSKTRFVAPALASLALAATMRSRLDYDTDGLGPERAYGSGGSSTLGGFFGFGLLGAGISQLSRPVTVGLAVVGVARTVVVSVFGKGRDVSFPADTVIEVQLADTSREK